MESTAETVLSRHRHLYLPWVEQNPIYSHAIPLALRLARHHRTSITVVRPKKSTSPNELVHLPTVTERVGRVTDGGIVLAYCPTYKLQHKFAHLQQAVIVLAEWPTYTFEGWAKLIGAYNLATHTVMNSGLTDQGRHILKEIIRVGYNGWDDNIARQVTAGLAQNLLDLGEYDREIILAHARNERGHDRADQLGKILTNFDQHAEPQVDRGHQ